MGLCKACRHWHPIARRGTNGAEGECCRFPPHPSPGPWGIAFVFPVTPEHITCGEWRDIPPAKETTHATHPDHISAADLFPGGGES